MLKEGMDSHSTLAKELAHEWGIFDNEDLAWRFLKACCTPYHPKHNPEPDPFDPDRAVGEEELFYDVDYHETVRLSELWDDLRAELSTRNRFFAGKRFVGELEGALKNVITTLEPNTLLYRARTCEPKKPHPRKNMGAPPADRATAGRANPAGISYLYLASTIKTVVSELRPHVGDSLSIGTFKLNRPNRVIDLRDPRLGSPFRWSDKLYDALKVIGFLRKLSDELSRPVASSRREGEYLPTQYLCEFLKTKGYDGILYKSGLGDGYNVALFDPSAARCTRVVEVLVEQIDVTFTIASGKKP
jgi:hypothetical protein